MCLPYAENDILKMLCFWCTVVILIRHMYLKFVSMSGMIHISIMCVHLGFGIVSELCDEWVNFHGIRPQCPALPACLPACLLPASLPSLALFTFQVVADTLHLISCRLPPHLLTQASSNGREQNVYLFAGFIKY